MISVLVRKATICILVFGLAPKCTIAQNSQSSNRAFEQKALTEDVVAEGVGDTPASALKNAFRAAVQQVVGAVVDTEVIVENDSIIEDRVLSYSDGFVTRYDEIKGSKLEKDGICRIKIRATVERKSLIAKLKAANISTTQVDGGSLYSEAVSQLQAESDAVSLIERQFAGFPESCIKIYVKGKPQITEKTDSDAVLVFQVVLEPDADAYNAFKLRLLDLMSKIPPGKSSKSTVKFSPTQYRTQVPKLRAMTSISPLQSLAPSVFKTRGSDWAEWNGDAYSIAIEASRTKSGDRVNYVCHAVELPVMSTLCKIARRGSIASLELFDENNDVIATERFEPKVAGRSPSLISFYGVGQSEIYASRLDGRSGKEYLAIIGLAFDATSDWDLVTRIRLNHSSTLEVDLPIKLTLDEIKSIREAKVAIEYVDNE